MKKYCVLLMAISLVGLAGCQPNLVVSKVDCCAGGMIAVTIANRCLKTAGPQLTYIEINNVDAADSDKPQTQYQARVPQIKPLGRWLSEAISFDKFSNPSGIDLMTLPRLNVVVRADAKNMVAESNENDNVYDANR